MPSSHIHKPNNKAQLSANKKQSIPKQPNKKAYSQNIVKNNMY